MVKLSVKPETLLNTRVCNLEVLQDQAEAFDVDDLQQMFTVLSRTELEMKRSSLAQVIFEMSILRLVDVRPFQRIDDMINAINSLEKNTEKIASSVTSSNSHEDSVITAETVESLSTYQSNADSRWGQLKREICERRPIFNHYFSQCQVITFDKSNLSLGFIDAITLDQVKEKENLQLIQDTAKSVCNREINVQLTLNDNINVSGGNPGNKKKLYSKKRQKTESEIIQDALDVFGGIVIQ